MNANQNQDKLDPTTEAFSLMALLMLESDEQKNPPDYPALWNELVGLCGELWQNPAIRMTQKFLRMVTLMRFFGVYPEERWKENLWRLDKAGLSEEHKQQITSDEPKGYVFWKPQKER